MSLGLTPTEIESIRSVIVRHTNVEHAFVFGSRANGNYKLNSDIDIAIDGDISPLEAESIAGDLEELPLPYRFDVVALSHITNVALREHIERVGVAIV